jgi:PAS domain S-box-containing protein
MPAASAKSNQAGFRRAFLPYFILLTGLITTSLVAYYVARSGESKDRTRFNNSVQEVSSAIQAHLDTYVALTHATTGLFAASHSVEVAEFHRFVDQLQLRERYPGIQGLGFLVRTKPEELTSLIASQQRQGVKDFHVFPEHDRPEYYPIIFLEPLDRRNQAAIGYDMSTEPVRREAIERARDTGLPAASGRVTLIQEIDPEKQPGFLIYTPVYSNNHTPSTVSERRAALTGFVYSPFRAGTLLSGILATKRDPNIDVRVFDGPTSSPDALLFDSANAFSVNSPRFRAATSLEVAGRTWSLAFATRPEFDSASVKHLATYTLVAGWFGSFLLFFLIRSQVKARSAAELAAAELRGSERKVRKTLSDRERAEEALRQSEERYRELFENANDIIYTLDLEGNITSVNKAGELITGYTRKELLGMNMGRLLTPESAAAGLRMLDRKLEGEARTNYEVDALAKGGRLVTLEISSRLMWQHGEPFCVQGVARDISKRRRAEEAFREADQRALIEYERLLERIAGLAQTLGTARDLQTIFHGLREFSLVSVPCDGFFVSLYDPARDVRTASYGWGDGSELDVSELPPMPITAEGPNSRAVRSGEIVITDDYMKATRSHPVVVVGPENGLRPQSSLAAPMAVMGRIIGTIEVQSYERHAYKEGHVTAMRMAANLTAVAIDNMRLLEQESRARANAEESNRLKDEFLATVSHELRTPLTAILGWARMLETGLDEATAARAIETIRRNAKSQSQIIDDILDVSRIITGTLYLELQPLELAPIIESSMNVVRPTAEAKGITIEAEFDSKPTMVPGDANRLQQVIWNLLSNAVKFTPAGGRVHIAVHHTDACAQITVSDNGQGITPEFLPFVFDRFRQADSTTTRRHGGLGLGLAIVRHLVEIHGGSVQVESPGTNKGATFVVKLPVINSRTRLSNKGKSLIDAGKTDRRQGQSLMGMQVLIVDDDIDTLEMMAAALGEAQAEVTAAPSVVEAMARIMESRPDVIVSDIAMPVHDGYELITKVRALEGEGMPRIPAIAITAYARKEDRERALSAGFQDYLPKPVEPQELIAILARLAGPAGNTARNGKPE